MPGPATQKAIDIFKENHSILRTNQALKQGISASTLQSMAASGLIQQLSRGLYQLVGQPGLGDPDLVMVAARIPKGVICLISALFFYRVTTQIPHAVYLALPADAEKPRVDFPPIKYFWLSPASFQSGIEEQNVDSFPVRIYSLEKTIADCFKFRNKIGQDVAIEALKEYLNKPGRDLEKLLHYARIDRVEKIIQPNIETLIT